MSEQHTAAQYDRMAGIYDRLWNWYTRRTLDLFEAWIQPVEAAHVLDVACGTGALIDRLAARPERLQITGADLSANMLAAAQVKLSGHRDVSLVQASAEALPFPDDRFDLVLCTSAFHYFDHPDAALREMHRVLSPGGRLALLDWCRDFRTCRLLDGWLKRVDPAHHTCYTLLEMQRLLENAGFTVRRSERRRLMIAWGFMLFTGVKDRPQP